jgi:hypothetical protein
LVQERALRNPPAYWALNVRMVVLGTRESRLGPVACGAAGSDAPPITGEPGKWFVSMLCVYSAEVDGGTAPDGARGYSPDAGERYARRQLMPDHLFRRLALCADHELAEAFLVPLEQIPLRRCDLTAAGAWARPTDIRARRRSVGRGRQEPLT